MKLTTFFAVLVYSAPAWGQTNNQITQYYELIYRLIQESFEVGQGAACGAESNKFTTVASLQLIQESLAYTQGTIANAQGNLPPTAKNTWNDALAILEAASLDGSHTDGAACAAFYQDGGPGTLQQDFPEVPQ